MPNQVKNQKLYYSRNFPNPSKKTPAVLACIGLLKTSECTVTPGDTCGMNKWQTEVETQEGSQTSFKINQQFKWGYITAVPNNITTKIIPNQAFLSKGQKANVNKYIDTISYTISNNCSRVRHQKFYNIFLYI